LLVAKLNKPDYRVILRCARDILQPDNDERVQSPGVIWNCPDNFPVLSGFDQVAASLAALEKRDFINRVSAPPTRL
jgi:hypothetical protein